MRSLCTDFIIFSAALSILFFSFSQLFRLFRPFIFALFLFWTANPLNNYLIKRKIPRSLCAFVSLFTVSLILFLLIRTLSVKLIEEISSLSDNSATFFKTYSSLLSNLSDTFLQKAEKIPAIRMRFLKDESFFGNLADFFQKEFAALLKKLSLSLLNTAKNIPSLLVSIFTSVFTSFFLLKEKERYIYLFRRFFGEKVYCFFLKAKNSFLTATLSYIKAQILIDGVIFAILLCGFTLLKAKYAFLTALICAFVDSIPILGTGTVLLPLFFFHFLAGNVSFAWGILSLYGISLLTRQLCEPKIVGKNLGIHPLATIFSLYIGMKIFGLCGFFIGSLAAVFIKNMFFS